MNVYPQKQAWRVVMMEAIQSLEVEWNETVVKQYQTYLAGRYPFDPRSQQDVPLSEFERFFGPKGTLDSFYQQNLKPFVENNLSSGSDGQLLIRPDVLQQLAQAQKIRETFFSAQNGLGSVMRGNTMMKKRVYTIIRLGIMIRR